MDLVPVLPTKLAYSEDMWLLQLAAKFVSRIHADDGRDALILDATVFYPQGGGQPSDTGFISTADGGFKFVVEDVRLRDGIVFHYGRFDASQTSSDLNIESGSEVNLFVNEQQRNLHSRIHSAGHLLDICMHNVGLGHLEPGKGYHFQDGPFVEYKGTIPQNEVQSKQKELEMEANALISKGGKVFAVVLSYEEASEICGGSLPAYISKSSNPRIVRFENHPGCPCGGTHVSDLKEIRSLKVAQIRTRKGLTKVSYTVDP